MNNEQRRILKEYDKGYEVMQVTMIINSWEFESDEKMYSTIMYILKEHNKVDDGATSWLDSINRFIEDNKTTFRAYN